MYIYTQRPKNPSPLYTASEKYRMRWAQMKPTYRVLSTATAENVFAALIKYFKYFKKYPLSKTIDLFLDLFTAAYNSFWFIVYCAYTVLKAILFLVYITIKIVQGVIFTFEVVTYSSLFVVSLFIRLMVLMAAMSFLVSIVAIILSAYMK